MAADVMHQRCVFEPFALAVGEAVHRACLIEEREGETDDLIGMLGVVAAPLCEFERAPSTDIRDAVDLRDLTTIAANVVENQPFAQRQVTERQFLRVEAPKNRIEQNRARWDKVRASRVESGNRQPLLELELGNLFSNPPDLFDGDVQVAQLCWSDAARGGCGDRSDAEDRTGRADHAIKTGRKDLLAVTVDFAQDMLDDLPLVAFGERVASDEAFGQPDRSNLEAARKLKGARGAQRNLHTAAADVDDHGAPAAHIHAIHGGLMNETRLFGS